MQRPTSGISRPRMFRSLVFLLKAAQHLLFHGIVNFAGVTRKINVPTLGNPFKLFLKFRLKMKIQRVRC